MRAWGGQGRQLAGLCQAESYLLEDMGIQDAPYWTEKGWYTLLLTAGS